MKELKFKIGDRVRIKDRGSWTYEIIGINEIKKRYKIGIPCADNDWAAVNWQGEENLESAEEKNNKTKDESHKGCDFVNGDFYRPFTKKNGSVIFNKVKVSTLCICKDGQGVRIATINSDERLQAGNKVRLEDDTMMDVVCCIKVMNKYIQDLVEGISETNDLCDEEVYKITGIYKEKEVTKTVTETELVLEEI